MTTHSDNQQPNMAILKSLASVMTKVGAIGKNNQTQGGARFKFRGIEQFMNTLHPHFAEEGIIVVPQVEGVDREERTNQKGTTLIWTVAKIKFEFISATDGSSVSTTVVGEGMDSGDKGMNKAMSIALKYALMQMLMIPTEETIDPDSEVHEVAPKKTAKPAQTLDAPRQRIVLAMKEGVVKGEEIKHLTGKATLQQLTDEDVAMVNDFIDGRLGQDDEEKAA